MKSMISRRRPSESLSYALLIVMLLALPSVSTAQGVWGRMKKLGNAVHKTTKDALSGITAVDSAAAATKAQADAAVAGTKALVAPVTGEPVSPAQPAETPPETPAAPPVGGAPSATPANPNTPPAAAVAPAILPHLELAPLQGSNGKTITLRCKVTDAAGRPLANVPVMFSIQDAVPRHDVGDVAYSNALGVSSVSYTVDFHFRPDSRIASYRTKYYARVDGSPKFIPAATYGPLSVQR